jgi:hypothetical protein
MVSTIPRTSTRTYHFPPADFEAKTAPPRWRVSLDENPLAGPTWEIVTVSVSSINLVINRVEKVRLLTSEFAFADANLSGRCQCRFG